VKIFRDDLPTNVIRAHAILAAATPMLANTVLVTEILGTTEDLAALGYLENLGAVEHLDDTTFELTSAGECFRSLVLLDVESS
jgi:hypothetical protein